MSQSSATNQTPHPRLLSFDLFTKKSVRINTYSRRGAMAEAQNVVFLNVSRKRSLAHGGSTPRVVIIAH